MNQATYEHIYSSKFFTDLECDSALSKLNENLDSCVQVNSIKMLGNPYYSHSLTNIEQTDDINLKHNQLMLKEFSFFLSKLISFFENHYQKKVITHEKVALPGFHLIPSHPGYSQFKNFHFDLDYIEIGKVHPELGIDYKSQNKSFTILLSRNDDLDAGIQYIPPHKSINQEKLRNIKLSKAKILSSLFLYKTGYINIQESQMAHNVYYYNKSEQNIERITMQGNLVETSHGDLLLYW
ncbi:MAG: hypothetical protein COW01_01985 [Bdellovibrionales bacterium CG12_big_fil_rev_8_21_14_0_65_38_15]|nr:MAG: hypothetical protein COW79_02220 [Bdellovibrionales bacterium CG22_combo_CG10-13_8_21_14_all_38_13]PIQ57076.1 MAG: hypothetical protein COW01_01985 [Bdellovibrionales bacterium CG12_big_fil_rev_8_21_14_0_65_38_15]PIR30106.1 MAG: hypothetical protein COV38_07380 [Bdellovibrionales bacterium CG11_big_fil_rev_8_21_14_0_20_38_13]